MFAFLDRHHSQVFTFPLDQIECAERYNLIPPLVAKQLENGQAVAVAGNRLAVDDAGP